MLYCRAGSCASPRSRASTLNTPPRPRAPPRNTSRPRRATDDAVALFERCKTGLKPDGLVVVKENICAEGFVVDKDDNSLTRSDAYMRGLFERAGLDVVVSQKQVRFGGRGRLTSLRRFGDGHPCSPLSCSPQPANIPSRPPHARNRNRNLNHHNRQTVISPPPPKRSATSPRSCLRCACTRCGRAAPDELADRPTDRLTLTTVDGWTAATAMAMVASSGGGGGGGGLAIRTLQPPTLAAPWP